MKITFLGTASGVPVAHRRSSALAVESEGAVVLLDAGEGVSMAVLQAGIDPNAITKVFISHTHADHVSGLPMLMQMMYLRGRTRFLSIHCPQDRTDWLARGLEGLFIFREKWSFDFEILPLPLAGDASLTGVDIRFFETNHLAKVRHLASRYGLGASSYGFLLKEAEHTTIVTSDIDSFRDVADVCTTADLLIIEATHITPQTIADILSAQPHLRAIVTHIPPEVEDQIAYWLDVSARELSGRLRFASDGMTIETAMVSNVC